TVKSDKPQEWRLCLGDKRGLHSAEQLIIARMHMSLQVYYHKTTRDWEAHLLCLFNLARRLAKQGMLPSATPAIVVKFFREGCASLTHAEFLQFDEALLTAALQMWLGGNKSDLARLSELASGYLFRHKVFACREINTLNFTTATKLNRELQSCGEEGVDWLLDEISFNSYSDFGAIFQKARRPGDEEIST